MTATQAELKAGDKGIFLIDKPPAWSSFKVVQWARRQSGEKKVGHAGTLDPFATGLLIVAVGRDFTRQIDSYQGMDKVYEAEFVFGQCTTTLDPEGEITFDDPNFCLDEAKLKTAIQKWTGDVLQVPPAFSAIHVKGERAYDLARRGEAFSLGQRQINIHAIAVIPAQAGIPLLEPDAPYPSTNLRIHCGKGTYIRALARDLALELGTQGYCRQLRRISIGEFHVDGAIKPG